MTDRVDGVPAPGLRFVSAAELRAEGYLAEANRRFFHPLGLALAVDEGLARIMVRDGRDDPEGFYFEPDQELIDKIHHVESIEQVRRHDRVAGLGYWIQPVPSGADAAPSGADAAPSHPKGREGSGRTTSGMAPVGGMRRFELHRDEDVSGVSGCGVVAEGVAFSAGGPVALRWLSDWPTSVVFHDRGVESLEAVHGHNGRTRIVWIDEARS